jgi:hypothetical protein
MQKEHTTERIKLQILLPASTVLRANKIKPRRIHSTRGLHPKPRRAGPPRGIDLTTWAGAGLVSSSLEPSQEGGEAAGVHSLRLLYRHNKLDLVESKPAGLNDICPTVRYALGFMCWERLIMMWFHAL